ncbi:MAG: RNA 2',3'-cyclic phosphodiesterase [Rubrobacter sp.]|nr:RNA 2',3'-cyclic phosphodiesterase [Rubrobacter sp.]
MRLFFAIFPPKEIQKAMSDSASGLRVAGDVRWVRPENIHLTLKFLDEVSDEKAEKVADFFANVAERHAPLALAPSGFGGFPSERKARVIWIGAKGATETLRALAEDIESECENLGFERESRPFSPHFTLGRARKRFVEIEVEREAETRGAEIPAFEAKEIHLVKSETKKEGAIYTPLKTFRLSPRKADG